MKSRFCPSPSGLMHLGNARTALFNDLIARHENGIFLLRIEDTDSARSHEDYTASLLEDLRFLGLDWHEGPEIGGPNEPYWQSQRQAIYNEYYEKLLENKLAYPCFCSEAQLALNHKVQRASGKPPRYPGTCRRLSEEEIAAKQAEGLKPTLRFKVPTGEKIIFQDLVRGQQVFNSDDIGDFIIRRAEGTASFMFCNAIDDALMKVTHALRGEDHLTNSPRQVLIAQALNLTAPNYAHISLILGLDGAPLSKRNGSRSVSELREEGYLPLAIVNYLARLGHYYEHDHFMSLTELAADFRIDHLVKSPAKYDPKQLDRWQKEAVMQLSIAELDQWLAPVLQNLVPEDKKELFIQTLKANILFPTEAKEWAEAIFAIQLNFTPEQIELLKEAGTDFFNATLQALENHGAQFEQIAAYVTEQTGAKGKKLFMPLRTAFTGQAHGPDMPSILTLMGSERARERIIYATNL